MNRSERVVLLVAALSLISPSAHAISPPELVKESPGVNVVGETHCSLPSNRNGNCGNYRWYNLCSGYIWIYGLEGGEAVGVLFGGTEQPCVVPGNKVKRVITYFRDVYPYGYSYSSVFLDRDNEGDGCPDGVLAADLYGEPYPRWNCYNFNVTIPPGVFHLIVRQRKEEYIVGCQGNYDPPIDDKVATDGPFSQICDPVGAPRSFYYGVNMSACVPWVGPTGRHDNFLTWLIVDSGTTAVEGTSWGRVKGLFH